MDLFLIIIALIWLVFASVSDLKKREVPDWLSYSLVIFAVGYRLIYSIIYSDWQFLLYGLFGLAVFVGLGYLFYYSRVFAGGDAKLLFGLGAILAVSSSVVGNLMNFLVFIFLMMLMGSVYGIIWSFVLVVRNKKKFIVVWKKNYRSYGKFYSVSFIVALIFLIIVLYMGQYILAFIPLIMVMFPVLFIYAKSIEESCMIITVSASQLTEGDWLAESVKVKGKLVKPYWEGLSEKELKLLKNYRGKVKVKVGIPFVPAILLAFVAFLVYLKYNLISLIF